MKESEDRNDDKPDWRPIAHRGQLSITVLTLKRAAQLGIPAHRAAELVVILHPDGGDDIPLCFDSMAALLFWMGDMQPHGVAIETGADGELAGTLH